MANECRAPIVALMRSNLVGDLYDVLHWKSGSRFFATNIASSVVSSLGASECLDGCQPKATEPAAPFVPCPLTPTGRRIFQRERLSLHVQLYAEVVDSRL